MKKENDFENGCLWLAVIVLVCVSACLVLVVRVHSGSVKQLTEQVSELKTWQKQETCEHSFSLCVKSEEYVDGCMITLRPVYYEKCIKCGIENRIMESEYCERKKEQLKAEIESLCQN